MVAAIGGDARLVSAIERDRAGGTAPPALTTRKYVVAMAGGVVLRMFKAEQAAFDAASVTIAEALVGIEALPIFPREAEDILSMSSRERHMWLKDGR